MQFSTSTFDASLEQILPTLLVGARLALRGPEVWSPDELLMRIKDYGLTVVNLPTAYWHQVVQEWSSETPALLPTHVRLVEVGGEQMLPQPLQRWRQF